MKFKIKVKITVEKELEIPEEAAKMLEAKVEYLKKTPVEEHHNCWEYADFNALTREEQLLIAFEELNLAGPEEFFNDEESELVDWKICD